MNEDSAEIDKSESGKPFAESLDAEQVDTLAAASGRDALITTVQKQDITLQLPGGPVSLTQIKEALRQRGLTEEEVLFFACDIIAQAGRADTAKLILDAREIACTPSAFSDTQKAEVLEGAAKDFGLHGWIDNQEGKTCQNITRDDILLWWDSFMQMAAVRGHVPGGIDAQSRTLNLWKATAKLRGKIEANPARYKFLPGDLANNPQLVGQILRNVEDPIAFIELMTGEAIEDMTEEFLNGFSTTDHKGIEGAVHAVMLALQRSQR